jgi:hypothetical protein
VKKVPNKEDSSLMSLMEDNGLRRIVIEEYSQPFPIYLVRLLVFIANEY